MYSLFRGYLALIPVVVRMSLYQIKKQIEASLDDWYGMASRGERWRW